MQTNKVLIIAEAGVNHNGDISNAFKLIDAAVDAGADYIKFQTFKAEKLVSNKAVKADYQIKNTGGKTESQLQMLQKLELTLEQHEALITYCNKKGIRFFSTAFDLDSLQYLADIGLDMVKIPSGEITNLPYLKLAAKLFDKVILSTGMANMDEIYEALKVFFDAGISRKSITILHCNTEYPTPMKDVNLKAMLHIQKEFNTSVGYSDHTLGIEVPIAAVALGAVMIEKHFTLNKNMEGPDHKASLEPYELKTMVAAIRNVEFAVSGSGYKEPSASEKKNIAVARKSIHLKTDVPAGTVLQNHHLIMKRPGTGISPMKVEKIIGSVTARALTEDTMLSWNDLL